MMVAAASKDLSYDVLDCHLSTTSVLIIVVIVVDVVCGDAMSVL